MFTLTVIEEIKTFIIFFVNYFPFFNYSLLIKANKYVTHCQSFDHSGLIVSVILIFNTLLLLFFNYNIVNNNKFITHFMINVITVLNICADMINKSYAIKFFNALVFQLPDWINNFKVIENNNNNNNDDDNDDNDNDKWGFKGFKIRSLLI